MATLFGALAGRSGDEHGEGFDQWLIGKSFSLLAPICRIGLLLVATILFVVDPLLFISGTWGAKPQHFQLLTWHACALLYFLAFHALSGIGTSHTARKRCLIAFFTVSAGLFSWFAVVSWTLSGDLSTYAIFLLTMVCVFAFPGRLRMLLNLTSTLGLIAIIFWLDRDSSFQTNGAIINLVALAVAALLIDGYLMNLNRALYRKMRHAEFERARADRVLYNALPMSIADELKENNVVKAEQYQHMAVLFVDIVGFTGFSASRAPDMVVQVLNEVFSIFDTLVDQYRVEKIKTIGDAYMVVGKGNVSAVADLALEMVASMESYGLRNGFSLSIRCGIHVGPAVAGVIGLKRFLYDVWGDAVNTASRMESTGVAGKIHVSQDVCTDLQGKFAFDYRGEIEVKGKGRMPTYFLRAKPLGATTSASGSSGTPSGRPEFADYAV